MSIEQLLHERSELSVPELLSMTVQVTACQSARVRASACVRARACVHVRGLVHRRASAHGSCARRGARKLITVVLRRCAAGCGTSMRTGWCTVT